MRLALIVAVAANQVIGRDNQLPWRSPEDLRYFRQVTLGKTLVMGRKTFLSIGRPLPGRTNIVVSRNPDWTADGVISASSLTDATAKAPVGSDILVIGGASLFAEALRSADRFYLTEIHRDYEGDVRFPDWDASAWRELSRQAGGGDPPLSFVVLDRIKREDQDDKAA